MATNPTVVFPESNEVIVTDRPEPAVGPEELLVETRRSLVSTGTELALLAGRFQRGEFPFVPGYSNVGRVVAVGDDVDERWVGERVATPTSHAAYTTATVAECRPVPDDVSDEAATFFRLAEIAMNGVRAGNVDWGETVAVFGLGLVGQLAVRLCRLAGARRVLGLEVADDRRAALPDRPEVVGVDSAGDGWPDAVAAATDGDLADVVVEATGEAGLVEEEFRALRDGGRLVLLGSPRGVSEFDFYANCHLPGTTIVGAHVTSHPPAANTANPWTETEHGRLFFDYLVDDRLDVAPLISHRRPHHEAPDLFEMLREDRTRAMGVVLDWTADGDPSRGGATG